MTPSASGGPGNARPGNSAPSMPVSPAASPQEQYDAAFALLRQVEYERAEKAFVSFIAQNKESPLVGNAHYWLGETYYVRGKFPEAAGAFAEGFKKNPKGPKAADNLFKMGLSLAALNQKNDACVAFNQLNIQYPDAAANLKKRAEQERKRLNCS
ncbi:hypothetical protein CCP2SC5_2500001 [Azospirillaceae bacterium]